jgi:diadenosine hexaphosphate hydrolase (ATP-forming)
MRHAGGVVVRADGHEPLYLLVRARKDPTQWVFPRGHIEPGETLTEAATREVREEAGVRASVLTPLGEVALSGGKLAFFLMRYEGEVDTDEVREIAWCRREDAMTRLAFAESRAMLARAHRHLESAR